MASAQSVAKNDVPAFLKAYPKETYHKLLSGKQVVGKAAASWNMSNGQIRFVEDSEMKLTLFKKSQTISTAIDVVTAPSLEIQSIKFKMTSLEAEIAIEGIRSGDMLKLKVSQAGKTQVKDMLIQEPMLVSPTIRPFVLMKKLPEKSVKHSGYLFEPSALTTVPLVMEVSKISASRWTLDLRYLAQSLKSEIDSVGKLWVEKSDLAGMPIEAYPLSAEEFKNIRLEGTKSDLVELAKVPFHEMPDARTLKTFQVKISGIDKKTFELTRHRQKLDGDILKIQIESSPSPKETLPVQAIVGDKTLARYLEGDTSIPVYDPVIQKKAREIVGTEPDLWKRAKLVHDFVFKNLEKIPTISVPNALEVLSTGRGDCNEHSVLYTALARAAGVPARTVVGLVYSDRFYGDSGFYYHAWVEVFTGKDWIAIDPTWNQIPADATHIAFVEGGLDQQVQVTALMGRIRLASAP